MEQQEEGRNDTSDTKKPDPIEPMSYIDTMIRVNSIIQFRTIPLIDVG